MTKTRFEEIFEKRNLPPVVSPQAAKAVSTYRKSMMEEELRAGLIRESHNSSYNFPSGNAPPVIGSSSLKKFAGSSANGGYRGDNSTVRQVPGIYSPLLLDSNLSLPRDRATINAWCRSFFALNPMVKNAILLHSTYPISKLNITCKNQQIQKFFNQMAEEIDLVNVCTKIAMEYWMLGEAFPYAELDESTGKWSRIVIQNPDYISVQNSIVGSEPIISLRPDENLKRIVTSNKPADVLQRQMLNKSIIEHVRKGENIPLSNFYVHHIVNKVNDYEPRGTGLPVACFRQLMLLDKIRENKFVQADNMINPLTLIKIGGPDFKGGPEVLEAYRNVWEEAQGDKDFKIFTTDAMTVERIGANSGILDTSGDITQLIKEIYVGLLVPQVCMDGGADTTYANGGVALDILKGRYMNFRNMMASWLRNKIFAPISKYNNFYEYKDKQEILIVPEVEWNHMSLFDAGDHVNVLKELVMNSQDQKRKISLQTLYRSIGADYDDEMRKIKQEQITEAILAKEADILTKMPLSELRALSVDDEIQEIVESPLPGEEQSDQPSQEQELPGMAPPPPAGN